MTGTSGVAFQDIETGEAIIAYTGTNPDVDGWIGKAAFTQDVFADFYSIFLGNGLHYAPAYGFYERMADRFGSENITLTGHSLGGNVAQRVALRYNAPNTVVYNAAPLYIPVGATIAQNPISKLNIDSIKLDEKKFTGKITHITTEKDPLNIVSDWVGGVYIGEEHILQNSEWHGLDSIINDPKQIQEIKRILTVSDAARASLGTLNKVKEKKEYLRLNNNAGELSNRGLTSTEKIFLDAFQAREIISNISTIMDNTMDLVNAEVEITAQEAVDLYHELTDVPWFFILSPEEMASAYHEAGVNYDSIVGDISRYCEAKQTSVIGLTNEYKELQRDIEAGIDKLEQEDQRIAAMFKII